MLALVNGAGQQGRRSPRASPRSLERAAVAPRAVVRRRRWVAAAAILALALALVAWLGSQGSTTPRRAAGAGRAPRTAAGGSPEHLVARRLPFGLPFALQDGAAVALGPSQAVLLGGLDSSDSSTAAVTVLDRQRAVAGGRLPEAQHDAQGALIDGRAYVFGGGQVSSYSHILSYDPATGAVSDAGSLPTATSDAAVAAIAGTAYVVGGYDGQRALDTIVAWRPGEPARVAARLPYGLRYAAAAASGGRLVIAGGSRGEAATTAIMSFDPATGRVAPLGRLPAPLTHAAAAALGPYVYVFGGRGAASGTQTAAIVAIDSRTGRSRRVGSLPQALSDAAAIAVGETVWLAGGRDGSGEAVASVFQLGPAGR